MREVFQNTAVALLNKRLYNQKIIRVHLRSSAVKISNPKSP
jgi:hypothetical protein